MYFDANLTWYSKQIADLTKSIEVIKSKPKPAEIIKSRK